MPSAWKDLGLSCGNVDSRGEKTRAHFGDPLERCACGSYPKFKSDQVAEDVVESWFECACGVRGPEVEDAYSDRATARMLWDRMRRRAA